MKYKIIKIFLSDRDRICRLVYLCSSTVFGCPPIQASQIVIILSDNITSALAAWPWQSSMKWIEEIELTIDDDCCKVRTIKKWHYHRRISGALSRRSLFIRFRILEAPFSHYFYLWKMDRVLWWNEQDLVEWWDLYLTPYKVVESQQVTTL